MALPYPVILFRTNLTPPKSEAFGTKTNQTIQGTNSPDNIVDTPNQTYIDALKSQRANDRSTAMPCGPIPAIFQFATAPNPNNMKNNEYFMLAGQVAIDTMKLYCNKATILANMPGYQGEGAAPGFDILEIGYYGVDPS